MAEPQIDPTFIGGQPPSQVPPTEQVADDQPRSVEENSFVINAPAVQHAGESDIKKMIMDAFFEARKRKLPSGQADVGLYEKNIDVLLSRGEVVVPPEIAKIIGYDKLRKINNRGKKEVEKLEQARQQRQLPTPEQQALGMRYGDMPDAQRQEILNKFAKSDESSVSEDDNFEQATQQFIPKDDADTGTFKTIFQNFFSKRPKPVLTLQDAMEQDSSFLDEPKDQIDKPIPRPNMDNQQGFIPASGGIEADAGLQKAMTGQYNKFANALNRAEWGGKHDTPEAQAEGYFLRTYEDPSEEGLLASNFGDINHLKRMKKNSLVNAPAAKMIATYNKGAKGTLRNRLSEKEKEFVDALIDQANLFLIYGKEEDRKGYDPKFDYGGKGNIQEVFPNDYKELYDSIGMILIESISETVDGDPEKFAKLWKAGDDPEKPFKDNRYLKEFTRNLEGFEGYLKSKKLFPEPSPIQ